MVYKKAIAGLAMLGYLAFGGNALAQEQVSLNKSSLKGLEISLSSDVTDEIYEKKGDIVWDEGKAKVIYQSDKDCEQHGSFGETIKKLGNGGLYDFISYSGGKNGFGTRYFLTPKFVGEKALSQNDLKKVKENGGIIELNEGGFASVFFPQKNVVEKVAQFYQSMDFTDKNCQVKCYGNDGPGCRTYIELK